MAIRTAAAAVLAIPALLLAMRYNMHMFQLNGYKNSEHMNRLIKNIRLQWLLIYALILGAVRIALPCVALDIILYLSFLLITVIYNQMRKMASKKKLVYTPRVKRMLACEIVIIAIVIALTGIYAGIRPLSGVFMVLVGSQLFMNVIANILNHPAEAVVGRHYINDAKRILRSVPDIKVIGVTGSYGKTSVKFYLQTLLSERYNVLVTPESFNTPMGVVRTIREHLKPSHEIFVCEMGARHVGDIREICDIVHPDCGVITSIGPQHLETFFNMENIKNTKFELADALPEGGLLFLNGDNEYIRDKAKEYGNKVFYFASGTGDGYCAKDISVSQLGTEFTITAPSGEECSFRMRLVGAHNVINVAGAIAVANTLGIPLKSLIIPVRRLEPVEHRMQLREHGQVTIIDDAYNSNPVGSKAAVETLAMFDGIRILITPGMVELGAKEEEYNYQFGTYAAGCCDYILLVGKKRTEPIRAGIMSEGFDENRCISFDKVEEALSYAYAIKGQGHRYILLENDLPDNY